MLRKDLQKYIESHKYIYAKSLRRKVFLDKLPDVIIHRKSTRKKRLQCFMTACDILHHEKIHTMRLNDKKQKEYEIKGLSSDDFLVSVHVREEIANQKNKKLYFVSCFYAQNKNSAR